MSSVVAGEHSRPSPRSTSRPHDATEGTPPANAAADRLARPMRWAAMATLVANIAICVTGAAVRLTNSGLGCPTWPECVPGSITPTEASFHSAVEFGNRLLTPTLLTITALAALVLAVLHKPRRPQLVPLAIAVFVGIALQAIIGGIVVRLKLAPLSVSLHFVVSLLLVAVSAVMVQRTREGDGVPEPTVPAMVRGLAWGVVAVLAALLVVGTIVTSSGPNGGDPAAARLNLDMRNVAWVHADLVFIALGLAVGLLVAIKLTHAPKTLWRRTWWLLGLMLAQGLIGYVQYFTNVPALLVGFHVLGATLVWTATVFMVLATRFRAGLPGPEQPEPAV